MNLLRRTDTTRPVVSPSLPLLKRTIHPHVNLHTVRIVKGVTVLPQGVARSSRAPSSNTLFLSTFPADKMIATDTETQRKQWKSSCQTSMSAGRCPKPRKYGTIRRLAREVRNKSKPLRASPGRRARRWSPLGHSADFRHSGFDACDSVQETLCSIPSLHRAGKIVPLNSRNTKFSVKTRPHAMVLLSTQFSPLSQTPRKCNQKKCDKS